MRAADDGRAGGCVKKALTCLIVICFTVAAFAADEDHAPARKEKCLVCGMFVSMFADWNAKIVFIDSTSAVFDGPKDMFKYYLNMKKYDPAKDRENNTVITVKDYSSKEDIDAFKAFYVIWGDIYGPMGHEPIPFEKETDAKKYLQEHHGRKILRFKGVTSKVILSLDNP